MVEAPHKLCVIQNTLVLIYNFFLVFYGDNIDGVFRIESPVV